MSDIHISFYLRVGRIHIFTETLRLIGSPGRICFLISADGQSLLMRAYEIRDLKSHRVPREVYEGRRSFEISSSKLCGILADLHGWNPECSYRVPGAVTGSRQSIRFSLTGAERTGKRACGGG